MKQHNLAEIGKYGGDKMELYVVKSYTSRLGENIRESQSFILPQTLINNVLINATTTVVYRKVLEVK